MHYYFTAISLIAGVCLGFGILYLFIGLRRKEDKPLNLSFALFALCYATTLVNGIRWYAAASVAQYIAISRFDVVFLTGAWVALVLYISYYTDLQPRIFLWALSTAFIVPGLVYLISPMTFTGEISGLVYITLPWGERLADLDATGSIWSDIVLLARLVTLGYIVFALVRQFIGGERRPAIILGLGILPFIAGIFYEILGESGVVPYIPFGEMGFIGIAVAASLHMTNSVIKTEEQLEAYQLELESVVAERTAKLTEANQSLIRENEERVRTENALRQSVEELAFLHQISEALNTATDLPAELERIAEMITDLFDAHFTHIVISAEDDDELTVLAEFVREPVPAEAMETFSHSLLEIPLTYEILRTGKSRVISDVQPLPMPTLFRDAVIALDVRSIMLVPLIIRGAAGGLLYISTNQVGRSFTQAEVQLAETIVADISSAIENARLLKQTKAVAAEEERSRIARELHDSVTQTMYSVSIVAEALPRMIDRNLDEAKRNASYLRQSTLGALAEMRSLLFELRPETLAKARLDVLLQQLADVLTGRTRVPVDVTLIGDSTVPADVKIAFYRIAQEIFNNIHKHAQATQAWVTLQRKPEALILTIRDNGQGFDPAAVPEERLGLMIMQERASEIGADFSVESAPGRGTHITLAWRVQGD